MHEVDRTLARNGKRGRNGVVDQYRESHACPHSPGRLPRRRAWPGGGKIRVNAWPAKPACHEPTTALVNKTSPRIVPARLSTKSKTFFRRHLAAKIMLEYWRPGREGRNVYPHHNTSTEIDHRFTPVNND